MSVQTLNVMIGCGSGAGGWWVDNLFEAADSGDVLAHPRITNVQCVANANPSWCILDNSEGPPTHLSIIHCGKTKV